MFIYDISCLDAPVCSSQPQLLGLSVGDEIDIPCSVSANPKDLTFHWFFNKTRELKVTNGEALVKLSKTIVNYSQKHVKKCKEKCIMEMFCTAS